MVFGLEFVDFYCRRNSLKELFRLERIRESILFIFKYFNEFYIEKRFDLYCMIRGFMINE